MKHRYFNYKLKKRHFLQSHEGMGDMVESPMSEAERQQKNKELQEFTAQIEIDIAELERIHSEVLSGAGYTPEEILNITGKSLGALKNAKRMLSPDEREGGSGN